MDKMGKREEVLEIVKRLLVGPYPLDGFAQENGEEIFLSDSPLKSYVTGVLYPLSFFKSDLQEEETDDDIKLEELVEDDIKIESDYVSKPLRESEAYIDTEISRINSYNQSAMGITFCVPHSAKSLVINVSVGKYKKGEVHVPEIVFNDNNEKIIQTSKDLKTRYLREQINSELIIESKLFPNQDTTRIKEFELFDSNGVKIENLVVTMTFRLMQEHHNIYTITLVNKKVTRNNLPKVEDCFFQTYFDVSMETPFSPLPDNFWAESKNEDYLLNAMLYHEIKTFAIGHGCAATWDQKDDNPTKICASVLPEFEIKPIVAGQSTAKLSMKLYSSKEKVSETIVDLQKLCDEYEKWIDREKTNIHKIDIKYHIKANEQITLCYECLARMRKGIELLKNDKDVIAAFQFMNQAMLLQQLHYRMPLVEYDSKNYDTKFFRHKLEKEIELPDFNDETTWKRSSETFKFGFWRPFQIAFILMNLNSMNNKKSDDRKIMDLIWFPTGGGKTEAYLGLSAFTILLRRIKNKDDAGTVILMRYTLRLLTTQQYERASSLICALEHIRAEHPEKFGTKRITIGLWVGDSLTPNKESDAFKNLKEIQKNKETKNVSVVLKCPWCGASMQTYLDDTNEKHKYARTPGYELGPKNTILLKCANHSCDFSKDDNTLPLQLFDDDIYTNPPTLLLGTVDKFATLPIRPEAKKIFGGDNKFSPPELIIQDELHLITGPLGSTVGLYETLIWELCKNEDSGHFPKIIASTATISNAKTQCKALYGCEEDKIFQFPVQGISYKDCFFAQESNTKTGRKYVGLYGSSASSSATASIFTFAAFLYAAKEINVKDENERDPYWTNLAYFNSMRELGQAATWFITDIKERLQVIYRMRFKAHDNKNRRYIFPNGLRELTSRMQHSDIPIILKDLERRYSGYSNNIIDVCLATNMVSVGVDISRLGLMTVTGQPKSSSEYIQATSRVGRSDNAPGLVFVIYNTSKPRDKSHYEKFQSYHSKLYYHVEPTSVTPFSRPLRERALHAVIIALHRFIVDPKYRQDASIVPTETNFKMILNTIINRAKLIDPEEVKDIENQANNIYKRWKDWKPRRYFTWRYEPNPTLMYPFDITKPKSWGEQGWPTLTSMRSVDRSCELDVNKALIEEEDDYYNG